MSDCKLVVTPTHFYPRLYLQDAAAVNSNFEMSKPNRQNPAIPRVIGMVTLSLLCYFMARY